MKHLSILLSERDLLIRYVVYSAPVEVRLTLPAGAKGVEELDLESVDVASLVRNLQAAMVSGSVVEADFTDCPLRRHGGATSYGQSLQSPFGGTIPPCSNASPSHAAMSSTQGPTPSHHKRHTDVFAQAWQTMAERNPSVKVPVFAGASYGVGKHSDINGAESISSHKRSSLMMASPTPHDDHGDEGGDASDDEYDPEEDDDGTGIGPQQLTPSCLTTQPGECPKPMVFDSASTECGDLFDPFENSGHPFALWLFDMALLSNGMLLVAPDAVLHAVLVVLRRNLNVTDDECSEAILAFMPATHPSLGEENLAAANFSTPASFKKFRDQLPSAAIPSALPMVAPSPAFISDRLQNSRSVNVRSRHAFLGKTKAGSFGEDRGTYPAAVRALALAGMFSLQIHVDGHHDPKDDAALGLLLVRLGDCMGIPPQAMGLVKVHALMIAQRRVNDEATSGDTTGMAIQSKFLALVSLAMRDETIAVGLVGDDLSPFHRYRNYVLESALQMTILPLMIMDSSIMEPIALQTAARLLEQTTMACSKARIVSSIIDTREISDPTDGAEVFRYILSELLSASIYSIGASVVDDDSLSSTKLITSIANVHRATLKNCAILAPHVPAVGVLVLRASYRLLSFALKRRWGSYLTNYTLPDTFTSSIHSLREALEAIQKKTRAALVPLFESPGTEDSQGAKSSSSPTLLRGTSVDTTTYVPSLEGESPSSPLLPPPQALKAFEDTNRAAVEECFEWLMPFYTMRLERAALEMQVREQEMAKRLSYDGSGVLTAGVGVLDIFVLFRQLFDPLPSAVVPKPAELFIQFTSRLLNQINTIAVKVCDPLCISQKQRSLVAKLPTALQSTEAAGFLKTWKLSVAQMELLSSGALAIETEAGMVQRINTLKMIYNETLKFLAEIKASYASVQELTGCPELAAFSVFEEQVLSEQSPILTALRDVCDCLGIRQVKALYFAPRPEGSPLTKQAQAGGFANLYLTDMRHYRNNKKAGVVLKWLYDRQQCSMSDIVDMLDVNLSELLPLIADTQCRNRTIASCHRFFIATVAELLLNGGDSRFFDPSHAKDILADIDEVNEYFASTAPKESILIDARAEELGLMLRRVVADVFSKETGSLLTGNPNYDDCPDISGGTPMSRMVLRYVLAHRKDRDAKRFTEKHPVDE